ncbi:MAG: gfo/Idh/MocA family oxidoreductase, partial [Phycisphaerae bacterium]|nr:gfo/Idh/MocA family oxidoreductase [Phycisphaerae bacterium]
NWGGGNRPDGSDPIPPNLDWESWIGTAPMRPYKSRVYHPGQWRRWLDFGTGTFGDMGCHIYDPVYNAIGVKYPLSIRSEGPAPFAETWPTSAEVHYVFPGNEYTDGDTVKFAWYDGGRKPPENVRKLIGKISWPSQGSITIGTKGVMLLPHVGSPRFLPEEKFPRSIYPKLPPADHRMQFIDAIRGEGATTAGFDYSGPLTETILLGGIAVRFPGKTLEWDSQKLEVTNVPDANQYVRRTYRKGWEVAGL